MEFAAIKVERRGRKRRRNGGQNNVSTGQQIGPETKKRAVETRSKAFIGRYVKKEFVGSGVFIGKIVSYDGGLYRVDYEDGDCEDLESSEVRQFLIADGGFDDHLMTRKKKLDELISNKDVSKTRNSEANAVDLANGLERAEVSSLSEVSCGPTHETDAAVAQVDGDADSSSDSCEYVHDHGLGSEAETPAVPPPPLPPSSGNIGVPEEYASHLFSVYSFLRSFSIRLFLSPFGLDDFVGSINCVVPNTLVDAIHVALMRALRRHLEKLSSDGSELASKCLRCVDWSLVDMLTWPVYLIHYLTIMGYVEGPEWKGFYADVLDREYYSLPVGRKLLILQILCDDVLESAELRAEIDMREESEVGIDSDAIAANPIENGPRRVHPRYSKTSACKDQEAIEIIADSHKAKSVCSSSSLGSKGFVLDRDAADVELDGNGDECRLCGMDGTLLCCDGCPSAYHSRCIGVSKMSIPEGSWFCPECTFNKIGPTITRGTSLRAAEIFGIDLYEQIFLGTCNHLLVLKASGNAESCFRYYNWNDIPKVLHLLCSSVQHTAFYSGICKAILHYWEIPDNIFSLPARSPTLLFPLCKESHKSIVEGENYASGLTEGNAENMAATFPDTSLDTLTFTNLNSLHREGHTATKQVLMGALPPELGKMEPTISTGSISHQADPSDLTHQSLADRSVIDFTTCTSGNSNGNNIEHVNGMSLPASLFSQSRGGNLEVGGRGGRNSSDDCLYMGSSFKPQAYINHYIHGDFAASAAAILAVLSSEENQASDAHALDNPRKLLSASVALQLKAFSSVAIRFFWPNSEKKIVEVPRERCGWCLSCKAPATSKKACLLNSAALNAIKGAMKILTGLRLVKNGKGSLPSIATYILYMEESLCGLIVGRFLNKSFRKQWRRHVEQASSCSTLKALLLEFEENIRTIAFSGDWVKLVDNWLVESSVVPNTACAVVFTQRRGPSSRRGRKQSAISEVTDGYRNEKLVDFKWWRGGKRSKVIFQKGILPYSMVKKAARQGGTRKISGMYYAESFEIPKRSRQAVWRAAVEMSKNASQLALQVRYLDLHVRWSDIPRPEQNLQDSKGPETEASAFRNAFICDKKIVDNMIRYGVAFGNQKHLPSRVMKNIIEVEENQDGKDKYWFLEIHIPLYLIKEYEERSVEVLLPSDGKPSNGLSVLQRRQLKASRRDIFSYLARKRDNLDMCSCASCQLNVFIRNAVKCSACQGYCHMDCTINSTVHTGVEFEILITCKLCYNANASTQNENSNESPTSPLPSQGLEYQNVVTVNKSAKQKRSHPTAGVKTLESSETKLASSVPSLATKRQRSKCSWGIIWRKKNTEDTGFEFRLKNIILKGNPDMNWSKPVCHLCRKPYNSDLMYICCETCRNWYHADAVELVEAKIFDVAGFKCCKCRRIRSPVCPYMDPESRRPESKKSRSKASKQASVGVDSNSGPVSDQSKEWKDSMFMEPTTPILVPEEELFAEPTAPEEKVIVQEDDSHLLSVSRADQIKEPKSEENLECDASFAPGPQKLPVRRQVRREDGDGYSENSPSCIQLSTPLEADNQTNSPVKPSSPILEWDASINGVGDEMMFDYEDLSYEDMEFEPQTYFSFRELLASEDGGQLDGVDASVGLSGNHENLYSANSQDGVPEQYGLVASDDQQDPSISVEPVFDIVHCRMCLQMEPDPDLCCRTCGLRIHSHCSPWVEPSSPEDDWKCGHCREWR